MHAQHPSDETLNSYRLGKLDDGSAQAVHSHLEACHECRKRSATMSSASFLDWIGGAQKGLGQSLTEAMPAEKGKTASVPPPADSIPPGLAAHRDYEIKKELGRGGMGVVYLAHNTLLGRDEVLKVMGRQIIERPGALDRFLREIRAVAKLRHANIVSAYSAFRIDESIVFAMEYVDGLDLSRTVKAKGPLPVAHAIYFGHQTALGLQHAHEEGLIHRDIKPGNLMLSRKGQKATVKILDFGLAKATREEEVEGDLTAQGQVLGTPDFIAPEQILDAKNADIRADIYSLGATLYYLLTGRPPFLSSSFHGICQAHISRKAEPLNLVRPEVPSELAALVAKMMAKDPGRRLQTPQELALALSPFFRKATAAYVSPKVDVSQQGASFEQTQSDTVAENRAVTTGKAGETSVAEPRWESMINVPEEEVSDSDLDSAVAAAQPAAWKTWPIILATSLFALIAVGFIIHRTNNGNQRNEVRESADVDGPVNDFPARSPKPAATVASRGPQSPPRTPGPTSGPDTSSASAAADAPPERGSRSDDKPLVPLTGDMSFSADNPFRLATRSVYVDDFNDPGSGWPKGDGRGYSDGLYWIDPTSSYSTWRSPRHIRPDSTLEVVGRLKSDGPIIRGAWAVIVERSIGEGGRGFMVKINGNGEVFLAPNPWAKTKGLHEDGPIIGPIVNPAIKPANQINTLLLVIKKRSLEIFVNSVQVYGPLTLNDDLTLRQEARERRIIAKCETFH